MLRAQVNPPSGILVWELRRVKPSVVIAPEPRVDFAVGVRVLDVLGVPEGDLDVGGGEVGGGDLDVGGGGGGSVVGDLKNLG